jgi:septum formation inhibitor MinC
MTSQPNPELEDELARFRREWQEDVKRRGHPTSATSPSVASTSTQFPPVPSSSTAQATSPRSKRKSLEPVDSLQRQLEGTRLDSREIVEPEREKEKERPQSALDLYSEAVRSEQEGRLNDGELVVRELSVHWMLTLFVALIDLSS